MANQTEQKSIREGIVVTCRSVLGSWRKGQLLGVFAYGSAFTGRPRRDSDLDIAVLDRQTDRLSWAAQAELMDQLERATGWPVDLRMLREGALSYQLHVVDQGTLIWSADDPAVQVFIQELRQKAVRQGEPPTPVPWTSLVGTLIHKAGVVQ